jgi:hypothetical protein
LDLSIIQGPVSVAPCQTLANITIRSFFIAVLHSGGFDCVAWFRIAVQLLERPPSRQKPPPEALHLFQDASHARRLTATRHSSTPQRPITSQVRAEAHLEMGESCTRK